MDFRANLFLKWYERVCRAEGRWKLFKHKWLKDCVHVSWLLMRRTSSERWGKPLNLTSYLMRLYKEKSAYCIMYSRFHFFCDYKSHKFTFFKSRMLTGFERVMVDLTLHHSLYERVALHYLPFMSPTKEKPALCSDIQQLMLIYLWKSVG